MRRVLLPALLALLLQGQTPPELVLSVGHAGAPSVAIFAGPYLATASWSNVALVDLASGLTVAHLPHASLVDSMDVDPAGNLLAVGTCDRSIQFWDLRTRQAVRRIALKQECAESVAFSPDGVWLAVGEYGCCQGGGGMQVWNARTGALERELDTPSGIRSVLFSRDGRWLVGVTDDGTAHLFEWPSGTRLRTFTGLEGAGAPQTTPSASPDGRYLAWCAKHGITVWDTTTGAQVPLPGARAATVQDFPPNGPARQWTEMVVEAFAAEFLDDGRLAYVNEEGLVLAKMPSGPFETIPIARPRTEWHGDLGMTLPRDWLRIRRDGRAIAVADQSRTLVWESTTRRFRELTAPPLSQPVSLQWSRAGLIAWADSDAGPRAWNDHTGALTDLASQLDSASTVAFDPAGRRLAVGDYSTIHLVDPRTRRTLRSVDVPVTGDGAVAFHPDGSRLVFETEDGLALFDTSLRPQQVLFRLPQHTGVEHVAFSPNGRWIAAGLGGPQPSLRVSSANGESAVVTLDSTRVTYGPQPPAFSSDSRWLASFRKGNVLTVWTTEKWDVERTWELPGTGRALAFAPASLRLAVAGDREAAIWDAATGKKLVTLATTGSSHARGIAWSPDAARVVTAGEDGVLRFWSASDGRLLASLYTFGKSGEWLLVAADGRIDGGGRALEQFVAWRRGEQVARDAAHTARTRVRGLWRVLRGGA